VLAVYIAMDFARDSKLVLRNDRNLLAQNGEIGAETQILAKFCDRWLSCGNLNKLGDAALLAGSRRSASLL